jgi:hypothetical protein
MMKKIMMSLILTCNMLCKVPDIKRSDDEFLLMRSDDVINRTYE